MAIQIAEIYESLLLQSSCTDSLVVMKIRGLLVHTDCIIGC